MSKSIRDAIRRELLEAMVTTHAIDRTMERLLNKADIRPEFPQDAYNRVINQIKWVQSNVIFNNEKAYQVHITNLPKFYQHWEQGDQEAASQGDMIYLLIRNNRVVSVFFRRKPQRWQLMPGVQEEVPLDYLQKQTPKEDGKVHHDKMAQQQGKGSRKETGLELPVVQLRGKPWYIDEPNGVLIYAKNTKKTISIDDALDTLPEEEAEKIFDPSSWVMPT